MTDIVERLREWSKDMRMFGNADQDLREAADEIERLQAARNAVLEEAAKVADAWSGDSLARRLAAEIRALKEPTDEPS